ncbi:hypothetical protein F0U60_24155 [Archangium minus]|uniref:Uncharacterized protein n=1 Tax=Archangium minus TaxID=83450 RepID=A0ABY9WSW1_9BACT|nr:hypothetical protein F0U60_24155 [Archangium minus]
MSFLRIPSWLLLGLACLLWFAALGFVALWPQHPTGARQLRWKDANGQPLASAPTSCGRDTRFPLLAQQNRVWVPCLAAPDLPGGGIALLQPSRGEARLLAPLPEQLSLERVEGLLPGTGGLVGLVYRASTRTSSPGGVVDVLVATVMNEDGWQVPPERLPGGAGSRLLGLGWSGHRLEVALAPARGEDTRAEAADAVLVRVGDAELPLTITREEMCLYLPDCIVRAAYRAAQAGWRFLLEDGGALREVKESGASVMEGQSLQVLAGLDLRVAGRLRPASIPPTHRLEPDGSILPSEPPPSGLRPLPSPSVAEGSRLVPLSRSRPEQGPGVIHEWEDQHWHTASGSDGSLRVGEGARPLATVALLDGPCTHLSSGFLVPLRRGLTLLTPEGCHVGLTGSGQRTDPLNLLEHLERSRVPHAVPALLWILLGLPLLLLPAGLLRWPRESERRLLVSALLACCYLLSTLPLISWLLPLLS